MDPDFFKYLERHHWAWLDRIERAANTAAVMTLVRDFVMSQRAKLWSSLPMDCQRPALVTPDDVSAYAFSLVRKEAGHCAGSGVIRFLAEFFSAASHRLSVVLAAEGTTRRGRLLEDY